MTDADHASPVCERPAPAHNAGSTGRSLSAWLTLTLVATLGAALDLFSKWAAFRSVAGAPVVVRRRDVLAAGARGVRGLIPPHEPVTVIPHALEFRLVLNPGAVFGMGPGQRWFFVGFTLLAIAMALWAFLRWTGPRDRWAHVGLGLVLAGGLGNLYDRLLVGCVRDFLHPFPGIMLPFGVAWPSGAHEIWPWVSNVADALLLVGIGMLILHLWRADSAARLEASARADGSAQ